MRSSIVAVLVVAAWILIPASLQTVVFHPGQAQILLKGRHLSNDNQTTTTRKENTYWYNSSHKFIKNTNKRHDTEFCLVPLHFSNLWREKQRAQQKLGLLQSNFRPTGCVDEMGVRDTFIHYLLTSNRNCSASASLEYWSACCASPANWSQTANRA